MKNRTDMGRIIRRELKLLAIVIGIPIVCLVVLLVYVLNIRIESYGLDPANQSEYEWRTPPQWTPDGSQLLFSYRGRIYAAESDGSTLSLIHGDDGKDDLNYSPRISPDGTRIAYLKYKHGGFLRDSHHWEIATSALDGSGERTLTDLRDIIRVYGKAGSPSWSPDGQSIAFVASGNIYTRAEDGSDFSALTDFVNQTPSPNFRRAYNVDLPLVWSQDGQRIAFVAVIRDNRLGERWAIYMIVVDGSDLKKVVEESGMPDLSPDGVRMAFAEYVWDSEDKNAYVERLHTISPDGTELREVASFPRGLRWDRAVAWSPVGSEILVGPYVASTDGSTLLLLPRPDGAPQPAGSDEAQAGLLADQYSLTSWSPDGSRIAIQTTHDSTHHSVLYTVARDGSDSKVLVVRDENGDLLAAGGAPLSEGQTAISIRDDGQGQ